MQDRYAGDVGDFGKFALLRALSPKRRLGVCWYLVENPEQNNDGRHRSFLDDPKTFRDLDADVFDAMMTFRDSPSSRNVRALEQLGLLPSAKFHGHPVPLDNQKRVTWFEAMLRGVDGCDLVFLDPDNGLETTDLSHKSVAITEISSLAAGGKSVLLYHHQTRRKGGASAEYEHMIGQVFDAGVRRAQAVRLRPYSSRFYFLLDGDDDFHEKLAAFADRWGADKVELFEERRR
jgi:hypothetical protein